MKKLNDIKSYWWLFKTFAIQYNTDYTGEFYMNNTTHDQQGNLTGEITYDSPNFVGITYKEGYKGLSKLVKKALAEKSDKIKITEINKNGEEKFFIADTQEVFDFVISKEKKCTISNIDRMDSKKFLEDYRKGKL